MSVYENTHIPILTYESEGWILNSKEYDTLQAIEMGYHMKVDRKTCGDRIWNTLIGESLHILLLKNLYSKIIHTDMVI